MAPHSSTLAWKIPWMEEPGRLSPWGHTESDTTEANQQQQQQSWKAQTESETSSSKTKYLTEQFTVKARYNA